eukprot:jgi/Tetstr1/428930/TSEL_018906.t1
MQEAGGPRDSVLTEVRGLRSADATRPGDVVQLDYMPAARRHSFVPCVVEEGRRMGEHLLALVKELAERGIASGHLKQPPFVA